MQLTSSHPRTRPISAGHLRAFDAVARHLNFRAAAEELSLTQSAVSRQIQALEDEVGTALFLRHTRAVELTSAGSRLLRAAGMTTRTQPPDHYGLTLVLGGAEGSLWELTRLHADLVDRARAPLEGVRAPRRELQWLRAAPADIAARGVHRLSPGAAWLTLNALLEVSRPDEEGSWSQFVARRQIAWKTGTSWGQRDAWAIGSSGRYTVGVWAGNASGDGRAGLTGGAAAAPILFEHCGECHRAGQAAAGARLLAFAAAKCPPPLLLITLVKLNKRCGASNAMRCAIMPPILTPTTCALSILSASSTPSASFAISATL